jgi:hypothetical protein
MRVRRAAQRRRERQWNESEQWSDRIETMAGHDAL